MCRKIVFCTFYESKICRNNFLSAHFIGRKCADKEEDRGDFSG
jgi:hypothetical protein